MKKNTLKSILKEIKQIKNEQGNDSLMSVYASQRKIYHDEKKFKKLSNLFELLFELL